MINTCLNYLKLAALSISGIPVKNVSIEVNDTVTFSSAKRVPAVVIYHVNSRYKRDGQDTGKTVTGLGGYTKRKYEVENTFIVNFYAADRNNLELMITSVLDYIFDNKCLEVGNEIVFTRDNFYSSVTNMNIDNSKFYVSTLELSAKGGIYSDRQKVSLNLQLEYIISGGNPSE